MSRATRTDLGSPTRPDFGASLSFQKLLCSVLDGKSRTIPFGTFIVSWRRGSASAFGTHEDEIFSNVTAVLLPVSRQHYRNHLGWSRWFYGNDEFQCLQLIFPESGGQVPWQGLSESVHVDLTAGNWFGLRHH